MDSHVDELKQATAYIYIEDTSKLDAPAQIINQEKLASIDHAVLKKQHVHFHLGGTELKENADYNLRVHISINGTKDIDAGDYVSTQSYPLQRETDINKISVHVCKVT